MAVDGQGWNEGPHVLNSTLKNLIGHPGPSQRPEHPGYRGDADQGRDHPVPLAARRTQIAPFAGAGWLGFRAVPAPDPCAVIGRLAAAVTGPRGRWVTIGVWLLLGVAGFVGRSQIDGVTAAGQSSFLPKDAESTRALEALERQPVRAAKRSRSVIVFDRDGGLSQADLDGIGRLGGGLKR